MGTVSVSLPSDGQTIDAADYNTPINTIVSEINGGLDENNLSDGSVTSEKLNATIACRAYRNAAQTIEVGTEVVVFDTENFDLGNNFSTSTGQFTAPLTGYYQVNSAVSVSNVNAIGDQLLIHIYVNGSLYSTGNNLYAAAVGDDPRCHVADLVPCTAGQTIEIRIQNATSATESLKVGTSISYVSIYFVGA